MGGKQLAGSEVAMTTQSIVMYTTRFFPFCRAARQLLFQKGWNYEEISVNRNPEKRDEMLKNQNERLCRRFGLDVPMLVAVTNC